MSINSIQKVLPTRYTHAHTFIDIYGCVYKYMHVFIIQGMPLKLQQKNWNGYSLVCLNGNNLKEHIFLSV